MFFNNDFDKFFSDFDSGEKPDLIRNIQRVIKCPNCGASYQSSDISVLNQIGDMCVVRLHCSKCGSPVMSTVIIREQGEVAVPTSDGSLEKKEEERGAKSLTTNDVLDFHNFLKDFNGDFKSHIK